MVMTMVKILLVATLFIPPLVSGWLKKKSWKMIATGKVTCDGAPMPYVQVNLMDEDVGIDQRMGGGVADNGGVFTVTGSGRDLLGNGKPDPYIKVLLTYYGIMAIVNNAKITRHKKSSTKSYKNNINFGTINLSSIHCRTYNQFLKALKDFNSRAQQNLPTARIHIITDAIIHGGTPYATTSTIRIPWGETNVDLTTAKHELAHIIRHSFDGNSAHFLYDVARFVYTRQHTCGLETNEGYAFNEGWAEYWAGECYGSYGVKTNYKKEGNVAKALRKLQQKCSTSFKDMVDVLGVKVKNIHSFQRYNQVHKAKYGCSL